MLSLALFSSSLCRAATVGDLTDSRLWSCHATGLALADIEFTHGRTPHGMAQGFSRGRGRGRAGRGGPPGRGRGRGRGRSADANGYPAPYAGNHAGAASVPDDAGADARPQLGDWAVDTEQWPAPGQASRNQHATAARGRNSQDRCGQTPRASLKLVSGRSVCEQFFHSYGFVLMAETKPGSSR